MGIGVSGLGGVSVGFGGYGFGVLGLDFSWLGLAPLLAKAAGIYCIYPALGGDPTNVFLGPGISFRKFFLSLSRRKMWRS